MVDHIFRSQLDFLHTELRREAKVLDSERGYISVSSFNIRMNPAILKAGAEVLAAVFSQTDCSVVHGIPHSGVYVATAVALQLGEQVRLHSSRKDQTIPATWKDIYRKEVQSFSGSSGGTDVFQGMTFSFVAPGDQVLVIDDICAHGQTAHSVIKGLQERQVKVVGFGVLFDKVWQGGLARVASLGVPVFSCVRVKSIGRHDQVVLASDHGEEL